MPSSCIVCCQAVSAFAFLTTGIHSLEVAVHSDQTVLLSLNKIKNICENLPSTVIGDTGAGGMLLLFVD